MTLQFMMSSILVFAATALLIEGVLFLFRIKAPRLRTLLLYLPVLKLPVDLFFYKFPEWNFFANINPLSCQHHIEELLIGLLPPGSVDLIPKKAVLIIFGAFTFFFLFRKGAELFSYPKMRGEEYGDLRNQSLKRALIKHRVTVRISHDVSVPCAAFPRTIFLPASLELTREEREAVIAHELEHLRWKDPLFQYICGVIGALFWWIPMKRWLKKIEAQQEEACDEAITHYNIANHELAEALVKVAAFSKETPRPVCYLLPRKHLLVKRLTILLNNRFVPRDPVFRRTLGLTFAAIVLLVCWIC